jgi:hypothetical protein
LLCDEVPDVKRARVFDPHKHCFNPLKNIDYKRARQIADLLYTVSPQGENTLTVRNGKRALLRMLLEDRGRLDRLRAVPDAVGSAEALEAIGDILASPVLSRVLCNATNFSFNPNSRILVRLNRAELGEFDALVLGLLLISHFNGQLVVPDFGFYGRDAHLSLIREERLIAGVNYLGELSPKLRRGVMLMQERVGSGAIYEDAETLALFAGLRPETVGFHDFVNKVMA